MTDFTYSTATELMARLRAGEVTSTPLLEQHIARVAQCDGAMNADHTLPLTGHPLDGLSKVTAQGRKVSPL
jgi:Asp-tRNA(Asn)/Glu-tRNA(Gln) amidotransferase A subunit family amidase